MQTLTIAMAEDSWGDNMRRLKNIILKFVEIHM